MTVKLSKEQKIRVINTQDLYVIMRQILLRENKIRRKQEHFWIVGLSNSNKILFIELVSLGGQNRVSTTPPDLFRMAIYKLAAKAILVHNHPSGTLDYSATDKEFTDHMLKAGLIINIDVIDHLVITEEGYRSMSDDGLIEKFKKSPSYRVLANWEQEMLMMQQEADKKNAVKDAAIEIAKKMIEDKHPAGTIMKYTGLTKRRVEGLMNKK